MNEEMQKILDTEYKKWYDIVKPAGGIPILPIRLVYILVVYPVRLIFRFLWTNLCMPVVYYLTRFFAYQIMYFRYEDWKDMINRDICIVDLFFRRSRLITANIFVEWVSRIKTTFRPYSYNSWIITMVGSSYVPICSDMDIRIVKTIEGMTNYNLDCDAANECAIDCKKLIKEMIRMIIKPKLFMINGEVHIGE